MAIENTTKLKGNLVDAINNMKKVHSASQQIKKGLEPGGEEVIKPSEATLASGQLTGDISKR